jgi:twitching motility protein PilT
MTIEQLLQFAAQQNAADLHLQTGSAPRVRVAGLVREVEVPPLTEEQMREYVLAIAPGDVARDLDAATRAGADFPCALPDGTRFRVNLYSHLGAPGLVLRVIPPFLRSIEALNLPPVVGELAMARRGLTLLSGVTGSGKSTTLAAMLDLLNTNYYLKILTIEDPVEFTHAPKKSLVAHVEVGRDTPSFEHGLRQALRQAPNVILVGELRDSETVRMALRAADTGHQVLSTVHSSNAAQTVERVLAMVPLEEMSVARQQLAAALVGVVSQRLVLNRQGAMVPVVEVLRGDAVTAKYILENRVADLATYVATGERGMQTFDQHVLDLYARGVVSGTQALSVATNPEAVSLGMRMKKGGKGQPQASP